MTAQGRIALLSTGWTLAEGRPSSDERTVSFFVRAQRCRAGSPTAVYMLCASTSKAATRPGANHCITLGNTCLLKSTPGAKPGTVYLCAQFWGWWRKGGRGAGDSVRVGHMWHRRSCPSLGRAVTTGLDGERRFDQTALRCRHEQRVMIVSNTASHDRTTRMQRNVVLSCRWLTSTIWRANAFGRGRCART